MTITASESQTRTQTKTAASGGFTVSHLELVEALKSLALSSAGRKQVPVCTRVLATVGTDTVELSGFDFDVAITVTLPATDTIEGRMLIEHQSLTKVLTAAVKGSRRNTLTAATVTVTATDGVPVIHVAGYGLPLRHDIDLDEFPPMPAMSAPTHVVDRAALMAAVDRVAVAADRGGTLPILTALRATFTPDSLRLLATDRYRLAVDQIPVTGTCEEAINIPTQTLTKLLARSTGDELRFGVETTKAGQWLTVLDETTSARIRLVDGDYPDVARIIDQAALATVDVDRAALLQAATRAAAITKVTGGNRQPVTLAATTDTLTIAPACEENKVKVTAPTMPATSEGITEPWASGLNPAFLLDAVAAVAGQTVTVHLVEKTKPIALTGSDSSHYRHVIMPVRLA